MNPLFEASWRRAWRGAGAGAAVGAAGLDLRDQLLAAYAQPHRAYHTLQHLGECLALFEAHAALAEHGAAVELALWFHDAIYEVQGARAGDNEARSAAWATAALSAAGAPAASVALVESLVMVTRHPATPQTRDEQLLMDIDLSILGAGAARFAEYERQIRQEYRHVPAAQFGSRRRTLLEAFLRRPWIYGTAPFRERHEAAARLNLRQAIDAAADEATG